ncbi:MAG: hypothetical protein NTV48_02475 [Candidatus Vogelbacteria bacterium]|nr:hypothetical protein [Candidatus Vogelbacteria bacterium]
MTNKIKPQKISNETVGKICGISMSLGLMFLAFLFLPQKTATLSVADQTKRQEVDRQEVARQDFTKQLNLEAKSFVVYDIENNKILFSKNEKMVLPLASLTKIMTVLTASDIAKGDTAINIGETTEKVAGVITPKENWGFKKLVNLTLVSSSNFGAQSIASVVGAMSGSNFITQMNQKAQAIGLTDMSFANETGLDINDTISSANGSAIDVANLFTYVLKNKPAIFEATKLKAITETSLDNRNHTAINTNEIIDKIPGLIASKTGLTNTAGGNLAIIANLGLRRPIAFVVMGSSEQGRFTDTEKLIKATENYLSVN